MTATDLPFWRPPSPGPRDLRKFGLLFCVLSAALAGYLVWSRGVDAATVPGAISAALLTDEVFGMREVLGVGLITAAGLTEIFAVVLGSSFPFRRRRHD